MRILLAAQRIPLALAEEDISSDETSGMVSNVLASDDHEVGDANPKIGQDSTKSVIANPYQDGGTLHQTDYNEFADNTAISININEEQQNQPRLTPPPDNAGPLSGDLVFCFEAGLILGILCSSTLEECESVQERLESEISKCEGFEIPPGGALSCFISQDAKNIKCESRN